MKLKIMNQLALTGALAFCLSGTAVVTAALPKQGKTARNTTTTMRPKPQPDSNRNERIEAIKREGLKKQLPAPVEGKLRKIKQ